MLVQVWRMWVIWGVRQWACPQNKLLSLPSSTAHLPPKHPLHVLLMMSVFSHTSFLLQFFVIGFNLGDFHFHFLSRTEKKAQEWMPQNLAVSFGQRTVEELWEEGSWEWMHFCLLGHKNLGASGGQGLTCLVLSTVSLKTPTKPSHRRMGKLSCHNFLGGALSSVQAMTGQSLVLQAINEMTILTMTNNHYSHMTQQAHGCQHPPCDNLM